MNELTNQDLDLLIDSLDAVEKEAKSGAMIGKMMGAMLGGRSMLDRIEAEEQADERRTGEKRLLRERCIVLKAKLVQIKQSMAADRLNEASSSAP